LLRPASVPARRGQLALELRPLLEIAETPGMLLDELLKGSPLPKPRPRSPWVRPSLVGLVLLILGLLVTLYFYRAVGPGNLLQEALAETNRREPYWRLTDIEARRTRPDNESNAALRALAVEKLLPPDCQAVVRIRQLLAEQPPQVLFPRSQAEALRAELTKAAAALAQARKLQDLSHGRFPGDYAADFVSTRPACEPARIVAHLLACEVVLLAQEDQPDRALGSVRAILGCARAVGDEPLTASQRIRMECRALAAEALQRALAQGVPCPGSLRALQQQLEAEDTESLLSVALCGERGGYDRLMTKLQSGEIPRQQVTRGGRPLLDQLNGAEASGLGDQRGALLRFMNQVVQAAALPPPERVRALRELDAAADKLPPVARRILEPFAPTAAAEQHALARLRCAVVAVAAERYRLRNGEWPAGPAVLQRRGYLTAMPEDPYDGAPVRWRRLDDGLVIYTLGPDGKDNAGSLRSADSQAKGTDVGFRLWDSPRRRQPPGSASPESFNRTRQVSRPARGG
jgi:hypothetical protein